MSVMRVFVPEASVAPFRSFSHLVSFPPSPYYPLPLAIFGNPLRACRLPSDCSSLSSTPLQELCLTTGDEDAELVRILLLVLLLLYMVTIIRLIHTMLLLLLLYY